MKLVLLSGGSGKRLWPMSNDMRSKQFLRVLSDSEGNQISMLQRVWHQLHRTGLADSAYVCASKAQSDIIHSQLGEVPLIEEPARRDTFAAIALSTLYLSDVQGCSDSEVMIVAPVDHFVNDSYFSRIRQLEQAHVKSDASLTLLGVTATEPSTKFGYITLDENSPVGVCGVRRVLAFVEKPDMHRATQLFKEGALWNCGVFCFKIGWLKATLNRKNLPVTYREFVRCFESLPKRSFDYEVVEHVDFINVLPYDGVWKDLGTWSSLAEEINLPFIGLGENMGCKNTHVINELGIPTIAIGCDDLMIVASPDGILVANKDESQKLKEIVGGYDERPMYQERGWGTYRVLDYQVLGEGVEVLTQSVELHAGKNISYQRHLYRREIWTIIDGEGEIAIDGRVQHVGAGDVIKIEPDQWHAIRANTRIRFLEVQQGPELTESDIERLSADWMDVLRLCKDESLRV